MDEAASGVAEQLELIITRELRVAIDERGKVAVLTPRRHEHWDFTNNLISEERKNIRMGCCFPDNSLSYDPLSARQQAAVSSSGRTHLMMTGFGSAPGADHVPRYTSP